MKNSELDMIDNLWDKLDKSRYKNIPSIFDRWHAEDKYNKKLKEDEGN